MAARRIGTFDAIPGLTVEETRALWDESHRELEFWQKNGRELRKKYPELAVAVVDGEVIDTDPDPIALITRVQDRLGPHKAWFKYFHKTPNNWAL
jgi:hypothetical protein